MPGDVDGDGEEFTELYDGNFGRIDLVGKGANGVPFLIAKGARGGLLAPGEVAALLDDSEPVEKADQQVTISGSAAAVARMIHEAAVRSTVAVPVTKEEGSVEQVSKADVAEPDEALPEPGETHGDLEGDLDAVAEGDPSDPASPAWEAVDAAVAQQAIELTLALRRLLCQAQEREAQETAVGDDGDAVNVWQLGDALSAVDCILQVLAPFAVNEQAEAAERQADRDALVGKEAMVVKAGRVLSTVNEQRVRQASGLLEEVLASLPAPVQDGDAVAKSEKEDPVASMGTLTVAVEVDSASVEKAAEQLTDAVKAKGDPQMAVFDEAGKLVGTIDPGDLSPIAKPGGDSDAGSDDGDDAADEAPAAEPVQADELQPQPPDDAGTPADAAAAPAPAPAAAAAVGDEDVTKEQTDEAATAPEDGAADVLKAALGEVVKSAMEDLLVSRDAVVKSLSDRLDAALAPVPTGLLTNGALPPAHQMRGQDSGAPGIDVAKAQELRAQLAGATDVGERERIQKALNEQAAAALTALHASARQGQ